MNWGTVYQGVKTPRCQPIRVSVPGLNLLVYYCNKVSVCQCIISSGVNVPRSVYRGLCTEIGVPGPVYRVCVQRLVPGMCTGYVYRVGVPGSVYRGRCTEVGVPESVYGDQCTRVSVAGFQYHG